MHSDSTLNLETQIAIIGGGGTGLSAAVAASEMGANAIVLEKRHNPGGNSSRAAGLFAIESPVQRRLRIDVPRDEIFKVAMDYAHWTIDPRIVRAFVDRSGDTIRWLEEKGITFIMEALYSNQSPLTMHSPTKGYGTEIIEVLAKDFKGFSGRMLCDTEATEILTDGKKGITGLLATNSSGEKIRITAKSVIIASGGYAGNKELLDKYCPQYRENMVCTGFRHTGDGLLMATKVGAATEGLGILQFFGHAIPGGTKTMKLVAQEPNAIYVNKRGVRFVDEGLVFKGFESTNAVIRQPECLCYTLLDERMKQSLIENGVVRGAMFTNGPGTKLPEVGNELQSAADKGDVKISNSWDDIAGWIGATPEALMNTINEYNSCCDQGYDTIFAKERKYLVALRTPPYYAIKCSASFIGTIGGIKINSGMEVIDEHDNPITGLYAGGVDAGGWESSTYCGLLAGSTLGFAINSGRIAGENAAKYALQK
ncbi:FAD-dependent oxidoreductase [Chloroflexota bacterium]